MKTIKNWFNNLKVAQKLMLISVFFMIPDSIMLYLFITSINENVHFAKLEQQGNEYQRPLERLLQLATEHRLLARDWRVGRSHDELAARETQMDLAFSALERVDSRLGLILDFTPQGLEKRNRKGCDVQSVRREWDRLKADASRIDNQTCDQRHLQLIADIRTMITHAGDTSNLILDPELDSYYLVDTTLMALPQTQDRLAQVIADGEDALTASGPAVEQFKVTLATDLTLLQQDDLDRIVGSTQTALSSAQTRYGSSIGLHEKIPGALKKYSDAAKHFDDLTAAIQRLGPGSVPLDAYLAAGQAARDASFTLWDISDQGLDGLLQNRIDYYVFRRTRSLGVAAAAFLAAILLVLFITRSISGPLKRQADELKTAIQSLREHEFMLEQRVRERTRELRLEIQERKETDAKLQASHRELLEASRRAGMAEIATGILHNVGNVLNSINVSCEIIDARVKKFKIASLGKTADLLGENQENLADFFANDGRGKMIPGFLSQLALHFTDEQANILKEISLLQANVDHVKGIVRTQQASASFKATSEELNLRELVEDAMRLNIMSLNKHDVRVVKEYREIPLVPADKHNVLQILVNLISNAKQAMKDSAEKTLTIGIEALNDGNVRVWVRDTGCGIAPENMTRIFAHGFTTKTDGHGFGLHSAALAAKAMKGSVTVQSDGPGRGSTFSLVLPMLSSQRNAA